MFGKEMKGWGQRMAGQVLTGSYFNIRDNDAKVSLVTAYDVARLIPLIAPIGGIYNVSDGISHSLQDLAMAMGNNRGRAKNHSFTDEMGKISRSHRRCHTLPRFDCQQRGIATSHRIPHIQLTASARCVARVPFSRHGSRGRTHRHRFSV